MSWPSLAEVSERSQQRLARMRELRLDRASAGDPDSRAAAQHEIDRIIAETQADLDALPESDVRLRSIVALVLDELREMADGPRTWRRG